MTKEQMIEAIQTAEVESYKTYRDCKQIYGKESTLTAKYRTRWNALYDLCKELEIPTR